MDPSRPVFIHGERLPVRHFQLQAHAHSIDDLLQDVVCHRAERLWWCRLRPSAEATVQSSRLPQPAVVRVHHPRGRSVGSEPLASVQQCERDMFWIHLQQHDHVRWGMTKVLTDLTYGTDPVGFNQGQEGRAAQFPRRRSPA